MKTLLMYVEMQALVTLFLVAFFWALLVRLERNDFFRFWTLGWVCFGGFLVLGGMALRMGHAQTPQQVALTWCAVLLGYLQVPLILIGAQSLTRTVPPRKMWTLLLGGLGLGVTVLAISHVLPADSATRYAIRSAPRQIGFALVYLYCAFSFFRSSRWRPARMGAIVTGISCLLGGSIQAMFSWSSILHLWNAAFARVPVPVPETVDIGAFWLNLDVAWECGVALGMVLLLLEDYQTANRSLRASEEKFSTAFRSSPDMISLSRLSDGCELEVNDSFLRITGFDRTEVLGSTAQELNMWVRPADRELFLAMLQHARRVRDLEVPFRCKNGSLCAGLVSAEIIKIEGVECLLTVTRDITARKREEEALRWIARGTSAAQRAKFFSDLARHLAGALQVRYALITECVDSSKSKVRALALWDGQEIKQGFEYEVKGTPCEGVMRGEVCHYRERLAQLFPEDEALARMNLVGYVGVPLMDSEGDVIGHLAIFDEQPVNDSIAHSPTLQVFASRAGAELEREISERALRLSEANYRDLFENANDMIYTHDLAGRVTSLNKAGERITGYSREEAVQLRVWDVVAPECRDTAKRAQEENLKGAAPSTYEIEILTKNNNRVPLEVSTRVVFEGGTPVGIQGIARDISERHSLEGQLRQAQKMEAIGRLAGGVAHDFNNLLMVIRGYSDLVLERLPNGHPERRSVERIVSAGDKAAALTRQLLAFSRKQVLQPRVLDLNVLLLDLSKMLPPLIREDIEFILQPAPRLGMVRADPTQLEQVIINLVVNARDAMPRGGKLTIETENIHVDRSRALIHPDMPLGDYVMLAVSDTGVGMDEETQRRIFEPFFTTKPQGQGTGLGLATVYGIVKQSGGYIWVYSDPGRGSNFKIYLPQVTETDIQENAIMPKPHARGTETILVVEDEEGVRELTSEFLTASGYTVLAATDAAEALRLTQSYEGIIHVLMTDIVMPGMSGPDLAQRFLQQRPEARLLFVSGYSDEAIAHHGLLDSNAAFLEKPFNHAVLAEKVRFLLDKAATEVHR